MGLAHFERPGGWHGDAGDQCIGLDRFGRVVDQRWIKDSDPSNPLDRFQYGYDRNSNRLYRDNLLNNSFDELYHANGASAGYDNLNQLAAFRRGALSDSNSDGVPDTVTTASRWQSWALDEQGNWDTFTTDGTGQTREHNAQNQVTDVGANELAYDNNGSTRTDENGRQYIYDAWNRLVEMKTSGGTQIARFSLDALNRRVQEVSGGVTKDFYYSAAWQVLEEQHDGDVLAQYVWSPVYVDALVLRDRDTDGNGSLDERLYVQQDANWNVTAVTNPSGGVLERYVYDPYGQPTALQADWTDYSPAQPEGDYEWLYLHQGGRFFRFDANAGAYYFRSRELSPSLGRWMREDPLGFEAGDINLFRYILGSPTNLVDPGGMVPQAPRGQARGGKKWKVEGPADPTRNTIVCDGKGGVTIQIGAPGKSEYARRCTEECTVQHELSHMSDVLADDPDICKGVAAGRQINFPDDKTRKASEIKATDLSIVCLQQMKEICPDCAKIVDSYIKQLERYRETFK